MNIAGVHIAEAPKLQNGRRGREGVMGAEATARVPRGVPGGWESWMKDGKMSLLVEWVRMRYGPCASLVRWGTDAHLSVASYEAITLLVHEKPLLFKVVYRMVVFEHKGGLPSKKTGHRACFGADLFSSRSLFTLSKARGPLVQIFLLFIAASHHSMASNLRKPMNS
jgi:hypothetical protein